MDEQMWSKTRNLARAFSEQGDLDEDVAIVLGEALLEVLAELLVPESERDGFDPHEPRQTFKNGEEVVRWLSDSLDSAVSTGSVADAKRQHPAYQPADDSDCGAVISEGAHCRQLAGHGGGHSNQPPHDEATKTAFTFNGLVDAMFSKTKPTHPEFLEGEAAYEAAPVGTLVQERNATPIWQRSGSGDWRSNQRVRPITESPEPWAKRSVLRWGNP